MDMRFGGWGFEDRIISEHLFTKDESNTMVEMAALHEKGRQTLTCPGDHNQHLRGTSKHRVTTADMMQ